MEDFQPRDDDKRGGDQPKIAADTNDIRVRIVTMKNRVCKRLVAVVAVPGQSGMQTRRRQQQNDCKAINAFSWSRQHR